MERAWAHFETVRTTVFEADDVARALWPLCVDMVAVARAVERGPYVGTGSAHVCVAHAGLAFRVCRAGGREAHDGKLFDETICELRYAQIAHALGVGLPSVFFGVVRLGEPRMVSCWPLGARVVVSRDARAMRARLETLATRLVALDACKPANWVVVDGELFAIDFETHMCFEIKTEAQRDAAKRFVPVMLALFEMNAGLRAERFDTGVGACGARELAETMHGATRALIGAFAGEYESFEGVRYGHDDVAYALASIFLAYTAACLRGVDGARGDVVRSSIALLVRVRAALEDDAHEHHARAKLAYATPSVYDALEPFTTLAASLVCRTELPDRRAEAIREFHDAVAAWLPGESKEASAQ